MDRVEHVARLRVPAKNGACSEREHLGAFHHRRAVREQNQSGGRMAAAELPDVGQLGQGASVEDRHTRLMGTKDDGDSAVLHAGGHDRKARIALDQLSQPSGEEIVELGKDDGEGGLWRHRR